MTDPVENGLVVINEQGTEITAKGLLALFALTLGILSYGLQHPKETFEMMKERKPS